MIIIKQEHKILIFAQIFRFLKTRTATTFGVRLNVSTINIPTQTIRKLKLTTQHIHLILIRFLLLESLKAIPDQLLLTQIC